MPAQIQQDGFAFARNLFTHQEIQRLFTRLPALQGAAGTRNLLTQQWCRDLAQDKRILTLVQGAIGEQAIPVRGILFDKSAETNWTLGLHQDTKIAVKTKSEAPGYTAWSEKEGVTHCRPPIQVLENSLAVRIHLDPCGLDNGALKVIPGSHLLGIQPNAPETATTDCLAEPGDVLLMKPLLWHGSGKSTAPEKHRRVIHIEYSAAQLAKGLTWAFAAE